MRGFLGNLLFVRLALSEPIVTESDACHFVGSRFAHARSECLESVCAGISIGEDGRFQQGPKGVELTCDGAQSIMLEYLTGFTAEFDDNEPSSSKRRRLWPLDSDLKQTLLDMFANPQLVDDLWQLLLGYQVEALGRFLGFLSDMHTIASRLAGLNWREWRTSTVPELLEDDAFQRFICGLNQMVWILQRRSLLDNHEGASAFVNFYFDLASLMGLHPVSAVSEAANTVAFFPPEYREVDPRERVSDVAFPASTDSVIAASELVARASTSSVGIEDLHQLLANWHAGDGSTAHTLLHAQIIAELCPVLADVVSSQVKDVSQFNAAVKAVVTLIDICRHRVNPITLDRVVDTLGMVGHQLPGSLSLSEFQTNRVTFESGFPAELGDPQSKLAVVDSVFTELLTSKLSMVPTGRDMYPFFSDSDCGSALAFGRAIGLAIREGWDLRALKLSPLFAMQLFPSVRLDDAGRGKLRLLKGERLAIQTAMFGVQDALGPGGYLRFSDSEWLSHFL